MSKRNTQQRRHQIVQWVNEQGEITVDALAQFFETSEVTIRKDLSALEESGLLLRRYGGAIAIPSEFLTSESDELISPQKLAIALAAAEIIQDHHRIILDYGRTTAALIPQLTDKLGLVVMTNALPVALALNNLEKPPTLLMTGGTWDPHSESFQGQVAALVLRSYDFDQLFIGADGLDLEHGTTTFHELTALSGVMAEVARQVVVMIESNKIGRKIPNVELFWSQIDTLISDDDLDIEIKHQIESHGVQVICAPCSNQK